jgi:hypothetical protein
MIQRRQVFSAHPVVNCLWLIKAEELLQSLYAIAALITECGDIASCRGNPVFVSVPARQDASLSSFPYTIAASDYAYFQRITLL